MIELTKQKIREILANAGHLPYTDPDPENFPEIEAMINYLVISAGHGAKDTVLHRSSHLIKMLADIQQEVLSIDHPWQNDPL